jgi:two-component system, cell cycle response regulator
VALYSLTAYLALTVVPDTIHTLDTFAGTGLGSPVVTLMWVVDSLLLGLTGMHPSMRDMDAPSATAAPDLGPLRLATLALASLLAPATLLVQYLRGAPLQVPLICASCGALFLLVIGRLAALVAVQRRMAVSDSLTGLRTRRYFQDSLAAQARSRHPGTAVVLLDVDHFKQVNDTYGHDGGDRVLREIARRVSGAIRPDDVAARYGGEEFAVLLPHTSPEAARAVAARIHAAVRDSPIPVDDTTAITVTVSVGVACSPIDLADPDRLTLLADRSLYDAKDAGRDCVVSAAR